MSLLKTWTTNRIFVPVAVGLALGIACNLVFPSRASGGTPDNRPDFSFGGGVSFSLLPTLAESNSNNTRGNSGGPRRPRGPQAVFQALPQPIIFFEYRASKRLSLDLVYSQMVINCATYDAQRGVMVSKGQYTGYYPGLRILVHLRPFSMVDPYVYGRIGYQKHQRSDLITGNSNFLASTLTDGMNFQLGGGCRFFWRSSWAIFTELGIGRPNYCSLGIYYKL